MPQFFQFLYYYKGRIISLVISVVYLVIIARLYINVIFPTALYLLLCLWLIWSDSMDFNWLNLPYSKMFQKGFFAFPPYRKSSGFGLIFLGWILLLVFPPMFIYLMTFTKSIE